MKDKELTNILKKIIISEKELQHLKWKYKKKMSLVTTEQCQIIAKSQGQ